MDYEGLHIKMQMSLVKKTESSENEFLILSGSPYLQ